MSYSTNNNNNGEILTVVEPDTTPAPNPLRWLWWLLGALVLAGLLWALTRACRTEEVPVTQPTTPVATVPAATTPEHTYALRCGDQDVDVETFGDDHIVAHIGGVEHTMQNQVTASGARFADGDLSLWEHQGAWELIHNYDADNEQRVECVTR